MTDARPKPNRERRKYTPVPRVYVQFRVRNLATGKMEHVKGKTVIVERATPEAVHAIIVNALKEVHERARKGRENGETTEGGGGGNAGK